MILDGKVAIVTGGSKGIGYAIAETLLKAGASVLVCGRTKSDLSEAVSSLGNHGNVSGELCDVRSEEQVKMLLDECVRLFGGIDILVNNAGVGFMGKTVEETPGDIWRQTIETNLSSVFYSCHHAIPRMKERGGGYIINISSLAGQNAHPKMAAYNASKFGLNGFTEALMQEVRQDNIKVTAICPGSVNTSFGGDIASESNSWQIQPTDIAQLVIDLLEMPPRSLPSKIELRPSKPPVK
jgi:NAD(P)-dependent dehydrogenase (short-subunit alcohol dehydrogenase family)